MHNLNFGEIGLEEIRDSERIIVDLPEQKIEGTIDSVKEFISSLPVNFGLECTSIIVNSETNMPERLFISRIEADKQIPNHNVRGILDSFKDKVASELGGEILFGYGKALPGKQIPNA